MNKKIKFYFLLKTNLFLYNFSCSSNFIFNSYYKISVSEVRILIAHNLPVPGSCLLVLDSCLLSLRSLPTFHTFSTFRFPNLRFMTFPLRSLRESLRPLRESNQNSAFGDRCSIFDVPPSFRASPVPARMNIRSDGKLCASVHPPRPLREASPISNQNSEIKIHKCFTSHHSILPFIHYSILPFPYLCIH